MQAEKRHQGRPRKKEGTVDAWRFLRAAIAMCAYDEARQSNQKHSVAVTQAVEFVKQRHPDMRISETGVKRILASWRPRNSGTILRFERSIVTEEEAAKHHWMREQVAACQQKRGLTVLVLPDIDPSKTVTKFVMRFAERPNYPRFNRKIPKEQNLLPH